MLQNFIDYCKQPVYSAEQRRMTFVIFFKHYLLYMLVAIFISIPLGVLINFTGITSKLDDVSTKMIFLGILVLPFFEETIFRLLLKPTRWNIWIFLISVSIYISLLIYRQNYLPIVVFGGILVFVLILIFLQKNGHFNFSHHFRYFFYLSVALFALLHMFNFSQVNNAWQLLILPVLVIPQFFMGLVLGYTRMVYGFIYAVLLHMSINTFMLLKLI